ncbi:MAG: TlpA disulfide reductase family protein [Acidobacteriota bacterium]
MSAIRRGGLVILLGLASAGWVAAESTKVDLCAPRPEVEAELERLGFDFAHVFQHANHRRPCGGATDCWRQRIARVEELLAKYPADLFLHRARQDLARFEHGRPGSSTLLARYRQRAEEHPNEALYRHLLGRVEPDRETRRQAQEEALRLDPDFAWSHLALAYLRGGEDSDAAFDHLERFMARCPDRVGEPLMAAYLLGRNAQPLAREYLESLRSAVGRSSPRRRVRDLPVLWTLEFRAVEPAEQPAVRQRIRDDLAALEKFRQEADYDLFSTLRRGYEVVGDAAGLERVEDAALQRFPCAQSLVHLRLDRWRAAHPPPDRGAAAEERQAFARDTYQRTAAWTELCPNEFLFWRERFLALSKLAATEPETLLTEGERLVEVTEATLGDYRFRRDAPHRQVAERLLEQGVYADRAAKLLERESELRDKLYGPPPESRGPRDDGKPSPADYHRFGWLKHELLTAGVATAERRFRAAEAVLQRVAEDLVRLAPLFQQTSSTTVLQATRAHYWRRRGDLAAAAGSRLDAVAFFRKASFLDPEDEGTLRRAGALWAALGGGAEGFRQLVEVAGAEATADERAEDSSWTAVERSVPELRLTDLGGKAWSREDLEGRAVLVNFWATWCAPCLSEIPYLKRLAQRLEGRRDIVLLSLNVDDNPGVVAPFVARREMTYPVLYAKDYAAAALPSLSLPVSWILGPDGKLRYEQAGFVGGEDKEAWAARVLALLEQVAGSPQS